MSDLRCKLDDAVNANREALNQRVKDDELKREIRVDVASRSNTAMAKAKQSKATKRGNAAAADEKAKQAGRRGIARQAFDRRELSSRRATAVQLEPIFITYNTTPSFNAGGGLLFYNGDPQSLQAVEISVVSGANGVLAQFNPFSLRPLAEPAAERVPGEVAAVESYVSGFANDEITSNTVTYTQQGTLGMDYPAILNNMLVLTFVRQRWVHYRAVYQVTTTFQGNPISQYTADAFAIPNFVGDVLVVKVNLETGAVEHASQVFQTHSVFNVRDAALSAGPSPGWVFHYQSQETLEDLSQIVAERSGFEDLFDQCAPSLFATALSTRYVHQYDTVAAGGGRLGLPQSVNPSRANINQGGLLIHSGVLLMSDPDLRYRDSSWLAQPRWVGLNTSQAVRVLAAAGSSEADYLEISEYSLDLADCEQVGWLDDYWGASFAGVDGELAEPEDVFAQDQVTLPSDGTTGTAQVEPINGDAPAEPYEATIVKNIPYINRMALAEQVGDAIAWVVYRVV